MSVLDKPETDTPDQSINGSKSSPEKSTENRFGFIYGICHIAEQLDYLVSQGEPYILDVKTEEAISQHLCSLLIPSADKIARKDWVLVHDAINNIIARLKKLNPDLAEAVSCATLDILKDLKEKIESDKHREKLKNALSTTSSSYDPYDSKATVKMYAQRSIDELKGVLDELRSINSFSDLKSGSKAILLGAGPHTYNDFIQHCGDETIEEYFVLVCQAHELAEEKRDAFYEIAVRKHLEGLIEFLGQEKEKRIRK